MRFTETELPGAFLIDVEPREDDRGFFARTFSADELEAHGLEPAVVQWNLSFNYRRGTLRGLHYQLPPAAETKVMRCTAGAIFDVIIDLRTDSPTYGKHFGATLSAENRTALYVPRAFAHGYQALEDGTEACYHTGEYYMPGHERGVRHDDPAFAIEWPLPVSVISEKDRSWPDFQLEARGDKHG